MAQLDDVQLALLEAIGAPLLTGPDTNRHAWPLWTYVAITFEQQHPGESAESVWTSLPWIHTVDTRPRPYGLAWSQRSYGSAVPLGDDSVGLSIPGLWRLSDRSEWFGNMALEGALMMAHLAKLEGEIAMTPYNVPITLLKIGKGDLYRQPAAFYGISPFGPPSDKTLGEMLSHEFIAAAGDQLSDYQISIQRRFSAFREVHVPIDYAEVVWALSPTAQAEPPRSQLPFAETLDYLAYVLDATGQWTPPRLTEIRYLAPVAGLERSATSREELQARLADLWNVLNGLRAEVSDELLLAAGFERATSGSLNRLQVWLQDYLGKDYEGRASAAMKLIRQSRALRNIDQHPSRSLRKAADAALLAFGLSASGSTPGDTWQAVLGGVAGAFDVIRQEVQAFG